MCTTTGCLGLIPVRVWGRGLCAGVCGCRCVLCVCVVVESIFCGALGVPETLLRYVNGGGSIDLHYTLVDMGGRQIFLG